MRNLLRLPLGLACALLAASCATQPTTVSIRALPDRITSVRTTAYTQTERGGCRNAVGQRLSNTEVKSAAADWSRWPLGTKFRVLETNEVFQIDDYGAALVGTATIDLYKANRLAMTRWGVRSVDIDVIEWGSAKKSLKVLEPRKKNRRVRQMIVALQKSDESHSATGKF